MCENVNYNNLFIQFSKAELTKTLSLLNTLNPSISNYNIESLDKYKIIKTTFNLSLNKLKQLLNYYLENNSVPICKICNKTCVYFTNKKLRDCCSKKCQQSYGYLKQKDTWSIKSTSELIAKVKKSKQTCLAKYGVDHNSKYVLNKEKISKSWKNKTTTDLTVIYNKRKQTCLEKYGVENPLRLKETKDKIKQTCLEKYGVEHLTKSKDYKDKIKNTCLQKYGVEHLMHLQETKDKIKQTCLEKYGVEMYVKSKIFKGKILKDFLEKFNLLLLGRNLSLISVINDDLKIFNLKCNICNHEFELNYNSSIYICCRKCNPYSRSKLESEIYNYLTENNLHVISNDRKTIKNNDTNKNLELDIYIPSKNLAIEINGIYYHSSKSITEDHLNKSRHLNKYNLCKENNIQLLQFTDLEFINKLEICYSIINSKLNINQTKIFARKCSIQIISNKDSKEFLNSNHIQGYVNSKINIGLYFENELVQLMTFGHSRFNKKYNYELIRLASKINTSITGGSEKLFKYFKDNYLKPSESIISYCDISKFSGSVYNKLGFKEIEQSKPNYFYWKHHSTILESRQKFQKHKLKNLLENFDPSLTEKENMFNNQYSIYYDCGNKVFVFNI